MNLDRYAKNDVFANHPRFRVGDRVYAIGHPDVHGTVTRVRRKANRISQYADVLLDNGQLIQSYNTCWMPLYGHKGDVVQQSLRERGIYAPYLPMESSQEEGQ